MTINVENILCLIWSDLFNFSPQSTPFVLISPGAAFGDEVEIWERSGRDEKNPSRAQALYTKAIQAMMGGMSFFCKTCKTSA
jgi:hypothetical protein